MVEREKGKVQVLGPMATGPLNRQTVRHAPEGGDACLLMLISEG